MASAAAAKKCPASIPVLGLLGIHQPDVRLMHQRRGLQRLARLLLGHLGGGQLPQFLVDQRQELLGRLRFALFDPRQDQSHVARSTGWCGGGRVRRQHGPEVCRR